MKTAFALTVSIILLLGCSNEPRQPIAPVAPQAARTATPGPSAVPRVAPVANKQPVVAEPPKAPSPTKEWHEAAVLAPGATGSQWNKAEALNRLATAGEFIAKMRSGDSLTMKIESMDRWRIYALELKVCIDNATADGAYANDDIGNVSILCMATLGWLK